MSTMYAINLEHNHEQDEKKKVERQQLRSQVNCFKVICYGLF